MWKVVLDKNGNQMHDWAARWAIRDGTAFLVDPWEFTETMQYLGNETFMSVSGGQTYYSSPSEMEKILLSGQWSGVHITGRWGFTKKGSRIALKMVL